MNTELLKRKILDLAIRGKLVEQRPEEGTSEDLYQQIQEEKQRIQKEGGIKKGKKLPPISSYYAKNFPSTWKVCYLDDIAFVTKLAGFEYTKYIANNLTEKGIPLFKGKNIQKGKIDFTFESFIPESVSRSLKRSQIRKKCLLTPYVGTIGNIAIFNGEFKAHLGSNVGKIELYNAPNHVFVFEEFVFYYLKSSLGYQELIKFKKATAQESISIDAIRNVVIPIPPLAEQKRIVDKIDLLFSRISCIENGLLEIYRLSELTRKKILDLAIRGKLVDQIPEEGSAEDLYQQIQEEKQNLIKEGKLKKEKPLAPIEDDEIPFDIPEDWKWVRLRSIVFNHGQKTPNQNFMYIEINSIDNTTQKLTNDINIVTPEKAPSRARKIVCEGDILYATVRPYLHNMCIVEGEFQYEPIASTGFAVMTCIKGVLNKYLFYSLLSPFFDKYANDSENSKGISYPAINDEKLYKALIPLPPLAEQKRIVAKVEELLALCDKLKLK